MVLGAIKASFSINKIQYRERKSLFGFRSFWIIWVILLASVAFIFSLSMNVAPYLHMDEFMIVELGRNILNPETDWSIAWLTSPGKPFFILSYLGPVLQELSFQLVGQSGPRISGLIGGLFAATMMVGWLVTRGTTRFAAAMLGLTLLLDPLFVQAYTTGRVDGWAIGVFIASCWIIRGTDDSSKFRSIVAGGLSVLAFFVWPSAIFLTPLVLLELINYIDRLQFSSKSRAKAIIPISFFCIGCFVTTIVMLLPVAPQLFLHIGSMVEGLIVNTRTGSDEIHQLKQTSFLSSVVELRRVFKLSPLLPLMAITSIVINKQWRMMLAGLTIVIVLLSTVIYMNRVLYLLPYCVVAVAAFFQPAYQPYYERNNFFLATKYYWLIIIFVWSLGLSIVARQSLIIYDKADEDKVLVHRAASDMIGAGNHKVLLLSPFELYYAGRSMGWEMYRPYLSIDQEVTAEHLQRVLPYVDFIILEQNYTSQESILFLADEEFEAKGSYYVYKERSLEEDNNIILSNLWRLRSLFHIYHQPYGPYILYSRKSSSITTVL